MHTADIDFATNHKLAMTVLNLACSQKYRYPFSDLVERRQIHCDRDAAL